MKRIFLPAALAVGAFAAYVDSRPTWDDTGVMVGSLFLVSAIFGFLEPKRPWLWALSLGLWLPVLSALQSQNYGAILALAVTFTGAYVGAAVRKAAGAPK